MTSKGNLKLASSSEETPINTVQVPQSESGHLTLPQTTWLSRLGINHRRSSMGFTMGTSMHELDEENSNSFSNAFSISKSTLGLETPMEGGEGEVGGHFVQVTEDGKFKLEGYQSTYHNYESSHSETLKDVLGTAINVSEFPVATQESLAQLEEMKMRLNKSSDDAVFDMDLDVDSASIPAIVVDDSSPGPSRKTSREQAEQAKPSKLLSNIMQSGFAQNWFFKGDGEMSEDKSQKTEEKFTSTAFMHDETENANFPFAFSGIEEEGGKRKGMTKATADKKLVEEQKQKREFRERNVFMPQNF